MAGSTAEGPGDTDMGIRRFHLVFISISVMLAAFTAAWGATQYQTDPKGTYIVAVIASVIAGAALAVYGAAFQRKTRQL